MPTSISPQLRPADPSTPEEAEKFAARLPNVRRVLRALYIGRVGVALLLLAGAAGWWPGSHSVAAHVAVLTAFAVFLVTIAAFWYSHRRDDLPTEGFLYSQVLFDTTLVSWVVYLSGGSQSIFVALYVVIIFAAAIMLPMVGGLLAGLLVCAEYLALLVWSAESMPAPGSLLQVVLFAGVAPVTSYLGDRLQQTGAKLGQVERELQRLRLDTDDILGTMRSGVITVDGEGHLGYINSAASQLLGIESDRWVGHPVLELLDLLAPGLGTVIARSAESGKPIQRFETTPGGDGALILGVSTTILERRTADQAAVTAIFQDITEGKRIDSLRQRAERSEAIAALSASLAHEIKNPLASIRSAVEQLDHPRLEEEDRAVLQALVMRESDRLSRLLGDFLDFARVRPAETRPLDVRALVEAALAVVRAHPEAVGRTIEFAVASPAKHLQVSGDEDLLHRAVLNLILNAVQWAGDGGLVRVEIELLSSDVVTPAEGETKVVRISVRDTGPGVPPAVAEQIFDPFFTRRPGGTGLGLALVQRAADAHGGAVFVDSVKEDDGSTDGNTGGSLFTFYLPALPFAGTTPSTHETDEGMMTHKEMVR